MVRDEQYYIDFWGTTNYIVCSKCSSPQADEFMAIVIANDLEAAEKFRCDFCGNDRFSRRTEVTLH